MISAAMPYGYGAPTAMGTRGSAHYGIRKPGCEGEGMNNEDARTSRIGLILGNVVGWSALLQMVFMGVTSNIMFKGIWSSSHIWTYINVVLATVVSSVVAAIVVVIAVRHLPVARPFLRKFVALLLLMTMLGGGFYFFATISHEKQLYSSLSTSLNQENQQNPATRVSPLTEILGIPYLSIDGRGWHGIDRSGALLTLIYPFASMTALPCFLLMLITPSFLALPVFWLWVVLSVLYVVLPQRSWEWMKSSVVRGWKRMRHIRHE